MVAGKPGPARKPSLQVIREGNPGKRPVRREIQPPPSKPAEPDWKAVYPSEPEGPDQGRSVYLRRYCRDRFRHYVAVLDPQGLLTANDPDVFTEMVCILGELSWERRKLAEEGSIVQGVRKGRETVRNPRWTTISVLQGALKPMIGLFGLAPGARLEGRDDDDSTGLFD